ncbi:MAG: hypothetical protein LQ342_000268, partial [Letrouitia transgressa]
RTEEDYWTQNMKPSILKGGTWTIFHWNQLITGHAQQRIQYSSDLRVPQAEIELEELFEFLLDRGAIPDAKGIHMLRISGLWTPTGTCLMLSPDGTQCVLRVSVPDESDGILSLALYWIPRWDIRDPSTLPPGWMRIGLPPSAPSDMTEKGGEAEVPETQRAVFEKPNSNPPDKEPSPSTHDQKPPSYQPSATSLRYRLTSQPETPCPKITSPVYEYMNNPLPSTPLNLPTSLNPWFAPLSLILALSQHLPLYTHQIPHSLHNLPNPIPSGVLEILGLIHASEISEWETKHDPSPETWAQHQRLLASHASLTAERALPPALQASARSARLLSDAQAFHARMRAESHAAQQRAALRDREAIASAPLSVPHTAKLVLGYLGAENLLSAAAPHRQEGVEKGEEGEEYEEEERGLRRAVEVLLGGMWRGEAWAAGVGRMLDRWQAWGERGGMNREDLGAVTEVEGKRAFCWAGAAVGLVGRVCEREKGGGGEGVSMSLAGDMRECVRVWRRVRVG